MISEAWAGVAGAIVGGAFSLAGAYLNDHLKGRKQSRLDRRRRELLAKTLEAAKGDGWVHIDTLAQLVGADPDTTRALLIEADARGSLKKDKEMWSLVERNPL